MDLFIRHSIVTDKYDCYLRVPGFAVNTTRMVKEIKFKLSDDYREDQSVPLPEPLRLRPDQLLSLHRSLKSELTTCGLLPPAPSEKEIQDLKDKVTMLQRHCDRLANILERAVESKPMTVNVNNGDGV